jgi:hypothetical protein
MFEIGAVVGARGQHDDGRVRHPLRRHGAQLFEQHVRIVLDRRDLVLGEQFGEEAHHHLAVFEHVRHTGRHAQVVFEDVELALAGADDIDAGDVRVDVARQIDAHHFRTELGVIQHLLGRNLARLENFLIVIDVVQEHVERLDALTQPGTQGFPFGGRNDARNDVERNQPLLARFLAIHGEGDADPVKGQIGLGPLALDALGWRRLEPVFVSLVMRTDATVGVIHLVIEVHLSTRR